MSVFDDLVGQARIVARLEAAVRDAANTVGGGPAMAQAWLFTGPPGSGRSNTARAFAAALVCPDGGCGRCSDCHTAHKGTHSDVHLVTTQTLSIGVEVARELVLEAAASPSRADWRIIAIEDADRLTEQANNALLKALEEPTPHTVWLLCAPSQEDVLPTIRSRVRHLNLVTPTTAEVAAHLVKHDGVDEAVAAFAARASFGHIGRARGLATDEQARLGRAETLRLPGRLTGLGACLVAAQDLVDAASERGTARTKDTDLGERRDLARGLGVENSQRVPRWASQQFKELSKMQDKRSKRALIDEIDRDLQDLLSFYRDVLMVQTGSRSGLVNAELRPEIDKTARRGTPESTLRSMEAILKARERIDASTAPLLAAEQLMLTLRAG